MRLICTTVQYVSYVTQYCTGTYSSRWLRTYVATGTYVHTLHTTTEHQTTKRALGLMVPTTMRGPKAAAFPHFTLKRKLHGITIDFVQSQVRRSLYRVNCINVHFHYYRWAFSGYRTVLYSLIWQSAYLTCNYYWIIYFI